MAFHQYGETVKIPRNEHVDIHVRAVTLNADEAETEQVECIEVREFIKDGEVYGHGLVIPCHTVKDLALAFQRVSAPKEHA